MKKAFTLVELIAVIILLGLLGLIIYPTVNGVINNNKNKLHDKQIEELIRHGNTYATSNIGSLRATNGSRNIVTFKDLYYAGIINDQTIIDPKTDEVLDGCLALTWNENRNSFDIEYTTDCIERLIYADNSGANQPDLLDKMIPIKYENSNWVYVDTEQKWYDYDNKEWANAVVLNSGVNKTVGDTINEDEIALWYVWIPRYKYQLFNANNGSVNEQLINVTFEKGTETTGTVKCTDIDFTANPTSEVSETCTNAVNGNWYTHPAFTFGNQELTGFWMGKFEISTTDTTCNTASNATNCNKVSTVTIKPNANSWRWSNVSNFFTSIQNISSTYSINNADSHMIKNMEWGAVAYLKQSKYGLGLTDIGINNHNNGVSDRKTGCGAIAGSSSSTECNSYNTIDGMLASTTGNITGVYDMSGGSYEYTMGNMVDENGAFYPSNSGFTGGPDSKYYDKYAYSSSYLTHGRGKLGDATKETLKEFGNSDSGWYDGYVSFINGTSSWIYRGDYFGNAQFAGLFAINCRMGAQLPNDSTRAALVRK